MKFKTVIYSYYTIVKLYLLTKIDIGYFIVLTVKFTHKNIIQKQKIIVCKYQQYYIFIAKS